MADRKVLERVLATYGADRDRWPAAERLKLAGLLAGDAEARRMLVEARALDRLLDAAPSVASARQEALAARIVADAAREPRRGTSPRSATAAVAVTPRRRAAASVLRGWLRSPTPVVRTRLAPAAALLAASLVAGLVIGWSTLGNLLVDDTAASRIELSNAPEAGGPSDLQQLVFGDDDGDTSEEEFL